MLIIWSGMTQQIYQKNLTKNHLVYAFKLSNNSDGYSDEVFIRKLKNEGEKSLLLIGG